MVCGVRTKVKGYSSSYDQQPLKQSLIFDYLNGKESLMLGARALSIKSSEYWEWFFLPESRFMEVVRVKQIWWFRIKANIETKFLSKETTYSAYLVYKFEESENFKGRSILAELGFEGRESRDRRFLDLHSGISRNGWMEIKIGEFFKGHESEDVVFCNLEVTDSYNPMFGLIVEGIEIRPKIHRRYVGF